MKQLNLNYQKQCLFCGLPLIVTHRNQRYCKKVANPDINTPEQHRKGCYPEAKLAREKEHREAKKAKLKALIKPEAAKMEIEASQAVTTQNAEVKNDTAFNVLFEW